MKSEEEEWSNLFSKLLLFLIPLSFLLLLPSASVDFEITLQTLFVNIAYNVTLNMQICTGQHLISHLSVKEPSVGGSPAGPCSDVTVGAGQKHRKGQSVER